MEILCHISKKRGKIAGVVWGAMRHSTGVGIYILEREERERTRASSVRRENTSTELYREHSIKMCHISAIILCSKVAVLVSHFHSILFIFYRAFCFASSFFFLLISKKYQLTPDKHDKKKKWDGILPSSSFIVVVIVCAGCSAHVHSI